MRARWIRVQDWPERRRRWFGREAGLTASEHAIIAGLVLIGALIVYGLFSRQINEAAARLGAHILRTVHL